MGCAQVVTLLRECKRDKGVAAVVLRVDSPGGEATASDLMWREIQKLAEKKPVVASMGDVAASGSLLLPAFGLSFTEFHCCLVHGVRSAISGRHTLLRCKRLANMSVVACEGAGVHQIICDTCTAH